MTTENVHLNRDLRDSIIIGVGSSILTFGLYWGVSLIFGWKDMLVLNILIMALPAFACMNYINRGKLPQSVRPFLHEMNVKAGIGYLVGIVGLALFFTPSGFIVSSVSVAISCHGMMPFGRAIQEAKKLPSETNDPR